jgi:hypothetical protein
VIAWALILLTSKALWPLIMIQLGKTVASDEGLCTRLPRRGLPGDRASGTAASRKLRRHRKRAGVLLASLLGSGPSFRLARPWSSKRPGLIEEVAQRLTLYAE